MCRVYRKPSSQLDLFATDLFLERAKKGAGKLLRLNELFPFESYRSFITQAIDTYRISHGGKPTSQLSSAGRRAMDPIFMLKCVVAQRLYGKADWDFEQEMLLNRVLQHWLGRNNSRTSMLSSPWNAKEPERRGRGFSDLLQRHAKGPPPEKNGPRKKKRRHAAPRQRTDVKRKV